MEMKAIHVTAIGGPEVLKLVEIPTPEPVAGTVRVRNRAVAINFHDIQARRSGEPGLAPPFVPGTDFAGVVDALGEGVEGVALGDRILGINTHGAYAEASLVPAAIATPVPEDVSFEQAAACPVAGLTAYFLIHDNGVGADTTVVAHAAAGSVGCFLGGLLRPTRATSIGLVSTDEKAEVARRAGWGRVINYRREDPVTRVKEITGGRGADLVLDSVAGPKFARSFEMTAAGGTVVLFGNAAGPPPPSALAEPFLGSRRNLGLRTYFLGTTLATELHRVPGAYGALFDALRSGAVHLPMEKVPLEDAGDAHARIESQQTVGKVILVP
jgi:NADPH2:quinone reductase